MDNWLCLVRLPITTYSAALTKTDAKRQVVMAAISLYVLIYLTGLISPEVQKYLLIIAIAAIVLANVDGVVRLVEWFTKGT